MTVFPESALQVWSVISFFVRVWLAFSLWGGCLMYFSWLIKSEEFTLSPANPVVFMKRLLVMGTALYVLQFCLPT